MSFDDYILVHIHRYKYQLYEKINTKSVLFLKIHDKNVNV